MASVTQSTVTKTVTKPVEVTEDVIILTLSMKEAAVVKAAVGAVSGLGEGGHAYGVYSALSNNRAIPRLYGDKTLRVSADNPNSF